MPYLEHIGIAVRDAGDVGEMFEALFGAHPYKRETVAEEQVATTFISAGTAKLELLEALDADSPIARFLDRHGEGIHHLAFEVDDIFEALEIVRAHELEPLGGRPHRGADGKQIFFLHPRQTHGVLIEFCQDTSPPLTSTPLEFRGGKLATYRGGTRENPPILLLHGALGGTDLETRRLFRELKKDLFVLAVDLPGHASSDDIDDLPFTMSALMEIVPALMDDAGVDEATVFGFSFGGNIALRLAGERPSRIKRLIVHAANPFWRGHETPALFDPERIEREQPDWARRLDLVHGAQQWKRLCSRLVDGARGADGTLLSEREISAVDVPVLVTGGDRDRLTPLADLTRLYELLPTSHLAVLPDTTHPFQHIDPIIYARMISRFMSGDGTAVE